ncbi:hypothetical protein GSI_00031 [Ganoderma sinense ZZ0214-1]|uniref:Uncharacterized protein n=1 Tax=Ganoderma sinense ZZ0214-1 TaxID=1077348 RepID=A0A2G8SRJ9_9APHY|nr:hypothetical protein GSI_00031 [Ganoderma sinense ZZ0214-1]
MRPWAKPQKRKQKSDNTAWKSRRERGCDCPLEPQETDTPRSKKRSRKRRTFVVPTWKVTVPLRYHGPQLARPSDAPTDIGATSVFIMGSRQENSLVLASTLPGYASHLCLRVLWWGRPRLSPAAAKFPEAPRTRHSPNTATKRRARFAPQAMSSSPRPSPARSALFTCSLVAARTEIRFSRLCR